MLIHNLMEFYQHHIKKLKALVISKQVQIDTLYEQNETNNSFKDQQIIDLESIFLEFKKSAWVKDLKITELESKIQKNDIEYDSLVERFNELDCDKQMFESQRDDIIMQGREDAKGTDAEIRKHQDEITRNSDEIKRLV